MSTAEQWKKVKGIDNYSISNFGRLRNDKIGIEKSTRLTKTGYVIATLKQDGVKYTRYIHRLVADAFVENPENLSVVNHIDENKQNNRFDNLEWCTIEYNNKYGTRIEKMTNTKTERYGTRVAMTDIATGELIRIFPSLTKAAEYSGVTKQAIKYAVSNPNHTSGGYRWVVV